MRLVAQPLNPEPLSFLPCPVFLILSLLVARKGDFFFFMVQRGQLRQEQSMREVSGERYLLCVHGTKCGQLGVGL